MDTVVLQIDDKEDYSLLLKLLKRLKIKVFSQKDTSLKERQKLLSIIEKGGSGKSIPDPLKWQKETRKDRKLPARS